jgi:hypothetical protein
MGAPKSVTKSGQCSPPFRSPVSGGPHSRSQLILIERGRNAFLRLAGMYQIEQTYCSLDIEVFKSKEPAGIIDQRQLSDKIMSLYNGSGLCFRTLS